MEADKSLHTGKQSGKKPDRIKEETIMQKRFLSILLCLITVISLLPIQAIAAEGGECANCSHTHWGDYVCDGCGLCSSECSNSNCWYETHCKNCGGCYMSADDWCDECGWCDTCMQEAHCQDCKRCFVGESKDDLCEDCLRCTNCVDDTCIDCRKCSDCADGVCEECNKCSDCFDEYEHCQSCLTHLLGDEPCGYCDDCAEAEGMHCEGCGACFEDGAEHCPVHDDDAHCDECGGSYCEECGECEFTRSGLELCDYCGLCMDCCRETSEAEGCLTGDVCIENGDWDDHFCNECGVCFCDDNRCSTCDLCKDCCIAAGICTECDCSETAGVHHHKYNASKWVIDQNNHWNECRVCHEKINTAAHKDTDGDGYCDVCGCDQAHPLYISSQPKDLVKKVTDEDLPEYSPNHPYNSRAVFSVKAHDLAGRTLTYQWYWESTNRKTGAKSGPRKMANDIDYAEGVTTDTLNIGVPIDGCQYTYEFFCEITATAADGTRTTITSRYARLRITHNYATIDATDLSTTPQVTIILDANGAKLTFHQGSKYHNKVCIGMNCGHTKLPANTEHTYAFIEDLGKGHTTTQPTVSKYFYLMECTECGRKDLRSSDTEDDIPHFITLDAPDGAYSMDLVADEIIKYAKKDTEIMLFAPTLNEHGHVFKGWEVINGDVTLIKNHNPGIYTFYMPSGDVELKAIYDSSIRPVDSIKIITVKVNGKEVPLVNNTISVKVGDIIEATATLTPNTNIIDNRVLWNVMDFGGGMEPRLSIIMPDGTGSILSDPTTSPVKLKAFKVTGDSKLHLRATAYASKLGTDLKSVSDSIYINIVSESEHVCEYEIKTVHPTCTLKGYTLYTCKDEDCGKSHRMKITESLGGHKDTDGDGYCDNLNKNTGKICGFRLSAGGSGEFVGQSKIGKAELTVTAPVTGLKPANALKVSASEGYTIANTQWMTADGQALDPNDTFAPGTVYIVKVTLEANTGYAFQLKDFASTKSLRPTAVVKATKFQINSVDVTPGNGSSKDSVNLIYEFTATEGTTPTDPTDPTDPTEYNITVISGKATVGADTPVSKTTPGTTVTLIADAAPAGKVFDKWIVEEGSVTLADASSATTTFTMPDNAVSVKATYKNIPAETYNLTTQVNGGHGTISAGKTGLTAGSTETIIFTPDSGYEIDTVTVNGVVTAVLSNVLDVKMDSDTTVIVTYKAIHKHSYGDEWKSDDTNHWHECSCGDKTAITAHSFKWVEDKAATETEKGSKHEECKDCGYKRAAVEIPATGPVTDPDDPEPPKTGDNSMICLWIALLFVSGGAVTGTTLYSRKKKCEE